MDRSSEAILKLRQRVYDVDAGEILNQSASIVNPLQQLGFVRMESQEKNCPQTNAIVSEIKKYPRAFSLGSLSFDLIERGPKLKIPEETVSIGNSPFDSRA